MLLILMACILSATLLPIIGCITVWNRYVYLSDGIMHILVLAGLLHAICGYPLVECSSIISTLFIICASICQRYFSDHNLVLNIVTTTFIALGIMIADLYKISLNIDGLFFGDLLLVDKFDVIILGILAIIVFSAVYKNFNMLVISALNEEIPISYGIRAEKLRFAILLISALSISIIIKIIGGLIISSLSIVPVFFARIISRNPAQMLVNAVIMSVTSSLCALQIAFWLNLSVAATIAILQMGILFLTFVFSKYIL